MEASIYVGTYSSVRIKADKNCTKDQWVEKSKSFDLTESKAVELGIYFSHNTASDYTAGVDNVKLLYSNYTTELSSMITRATALSNDALASAISTAQGVLDAADNTVAYQTTIDNAVSTLQTAIIAAQNTNGNALTAAVKNPGFEGAQMWYVKTTSADTYHADAWTNSSPFGSNVYHYSTTTTDQKSEDSQSYKVRFNWADASCELSQTIPGLSLGRYVITADVKATNGSNSTIEVYVKGNSTKGEPVTAATSDFQTISATVDLNAAGNLDIILGMDYDYTGDGSSGSEAIMYWDNITLTYYSPVDLYNSTKSDAQDTYDDSEYNNVTGTERTTLYNLLNPDPAPSTVAQYFKAIDDINDAVSAFTAAKTNYDALATVNGYITAAGTLTYADSDKKPSTVSATSTSDAVTKTSSQYTALRAYYESHALAENVAEAEDYSSAVAAANAETNTGWTNGVGIKNGDQPYTNSDGTTASKYLDGGWASNAACNIDMTRTVEIPAGRYLLTVKARGAQDLTVYTLSIAGETINLPCNGNSNGVFGNGWGDASVEFESDGTAQTLEVIAQSTANQQWFSMNDFRLVQLELNTDAYAGTTEYTALNNAIEAAETKTLGFENGQYAPYNNVAALEALVAAKAIDPTAELTNLKTDVEAATNALTNATWTANATDVDAIYDGHLANAPIQATSANVVLPGWVTKDGNTRQTFKGTESKACLDEDEVGLFVHPGTYNYGETTGYTMPLKAGTVYVVSAKYCSWSDNSNNNFTLTIKKDESPVTTKSFGANKSVCTSADAFKSVKWFFKPTDDGDYVLSVVTDGNTFMTDFSLVKATATVINETVDYTPTAGDAYVQLTRNFNDNAWNSLVLPFNMSLAEAKEVFGNDDLIIANYTGTTTDQLQFSTSKASIVANQPVLVYGATNVASAEILNRTIVSETPEYTPTGANFTFVGSYAATTNLAAGDYFIGSDNNIYFVGATIPSMKGTRAFFRPVTPGVRAMSFSVDGETTGIMSIENGELKIENAEIYNLAGQRVSKPTKGLYIANGKKVIKK